MYDDVLALQEQLRSELSYGHMPRRIRINPDFYQALSMVVDEVESDDVWGIDIIEDPLTVEYELEY